MKRLPIVVAALAFVATAARAQVALPKSQGPGGSCPHGYTQSGAFCVPSQRGAQDAVPKPPTVGVRGDGYRAATTVCGAAAGASVRSPTRLCGDARGRDEGIRQVVAARELAAPGSASPLRLRGKPEPEKFPRYLLITGAVVEPLDHVAE